MLGKILKVEEISNFETSTCSKVNGKNGSRMGIASMINVLAGAESYDGYYVETEKHKYHILISNRQNCCESWGYMCSEDEPGVFIGEELLEVNVTDTALNKLSVEVGDMYLDDGGIQFVDFVTAKGVFQLAVYNEHNGYYGHPIIVAKDMEVLINDCL